MSAVDIEINAEVTVRGLTRAAEADLIAANTFTNPEHARLARLNLWTGDTEETIGLWRRTPAGLVVPRGTLPQVLTLCRQHALVFQTIDQTVAPPLETIPTGGALFPYQKRALSDLLRHPTGFIEAPTGSGKTNILLSAIPELGTTALILTHTTELFRQTRDRCRQWLGVVPGALGAGLWEVQPITVAMIQTLARRSLDTLTRYFGCILVDEAHHAPARSWAHLVNQFRARFKYGFTATAWRKDHLECLMWRTIGPITAKVKQADVVSAGTIVAPDVETVDTAFTFNLEDPTDWTRMIRALVRDEDRNALIEGEVRARVTPQVRALVLSDRIEHVHALAEGLAELQPVVLTGDMGTADRAAAMAAVRAGAPLTIATTSLLGEGVDVPGWDLLFLTTPMAGGPRTLQAVGRVSRAAPGKARALVVDFADREVPALAGAHWQRVRLYARLRVAS